MFRSVVLLAFLTGCPLLDVEVGVDDLCVTQTGVAIPAAPVAVDMELAQDFTFDNLDALHKLTSIDGSVAFESATLVPHGPGDLSFVDSAHLAISADGKPALDAFDCDGDCFDASDALNLSAMAKANVLDYLRAQQLAGSLTMKGTMPTSDWTLDVTVCMSGTVGETIDP